MTQTKEIEFCLYPVSSTIKLNSNISKVLYSISSGESQLLSTSRHPHDPALRDQCTQRNAYQQTLYQVERDRGKTKTERASKAKQSRTM